MLEKEKKRGKEKRGERKTFASSSLLVGMRKEVPSFQMGFKVLGTAFVLHFLVDFPPSLTC